MRAYYTTAALGTIFAVNGFLALILGAVLGMDHFEFVGYAVLAFAAAAALLAVGRMLHRVLDDITTRH